MVGVGRMPMSTTSQPAASKPRELPDQNQEHHDRPCHQHQRELAKRLLLLSVQAAVFERYSRRQRHPGHALLDLVDRGAEVDTLQPRRDVHDGTLALADRKSTRLNS